VKQEKNASLLWALMMPYGLATSQLGNAMPVKLAIVVRIAVIVDFKGHQVM
jgi:hypothetical protein